jgi:hypothetical protein
VIDSRLKVLTADFAVKASHAGFLVDFNGDGLFVITEEASEGCGERLALRFEFSRLLGSADGVLKGLSPFWDLAVSAKTSFFYPAFKSDRFHFYQDSFHMDTVKGQHLPSLSLC